MMIDSETRSRWAELQELEDIVRELTLSALKLPPGLQRSESLIMIGSFRQRVAAMKESELAIAKMRNLKRTA
jgi:hypothetical protein